MKIFLTLSLLAYLGLSKCQAQSGQPIAVPILIESPKIDSLMDLVLKEENLPDQAKKTLLKKKLPVNGDFQMEG